LSIRRIVIKRMARGEVEEEYVPLAKRVKEEPVEEATLIEELVDTEV
jgi:hypothetical protein